MNLLLARGVWLPYDSISNYNMETFTKAEATIRAEGNELQLILTKKQFNCIKEKF